jgi:hypothetical protein
MRIHIYEEPFGQARAGQLDLNMVEGVQHPRLERNFCDGNPNNDNRREENREGYGGEIVNLETHLDSSN